MGGGKNKGGRKQKQSFLNAERRRVELARYDLRGNPERERLKAEDRMYYMHSTPALRNSLSNSRENWSVKPEDGLRRRSEPRPRQIWVEDERAYASSEADTVVLEEEEEDHASSGSEEDEGQVLKKENLDDFQKSCVEKMAAAKKQFKQACVEAVEQAKEAGSRIFTEKDLLELTKSVQDQHEAARPDPERKLRQLHQTINEMIKGDVKDKTKLEVLKKEMSDTLGVMEESMEKHKVWERNPESIKKFYNLGVDLGEEKPSSEKPEGARRKEPIRTEKVKKKKPESLEGAVGGQEEQISPASKYAERYHEIPQKEKRRTGPPQDRMFSEQWKEDRRYDFYQKKEKKTQLEKKAEDKAQKSTKEQIWKRKIHEQKVGLPGAGGEEKIMDQAKNKPTRKAEKNQLVPKKEERSGDQNIQVPRKPPAKRNIQEEMTKFIDQGMEEVIEEVMEDLNKPKEDEAGSEVEEEAAEFSEEEFHKIRKERQDKMLEIFASCQIEDNTKNRREEEVSSTRINKKQLEDIVQKGNEEFLQKMKMVMNQKGTATPEVPALSTSGTPDSSEAVKKILADNNKLLNEQLTILREEMMKNREEVQKMSSRTSEEQNTGSESKGGRLDEESVKQWIEASGESLLKKFQERNGEEGSKKSPSSATSVFTSTRVPESRLEQTGLEVDNISGIDDRTYNLGRSADPKVHFSKPPTGEMSSREKESNITKDLLREQGIREEDIEHYSSMSRIQGLEASMITSAGSSNTTIVQTSADLPRFSGEIIEFRQWRQRWLAQISCYPMSQRLGHLTVCIDEVSQSLISNIYGFAEASYNKAWVIMNEKYDKPDLVRQMLIQQVNELVQTECNYDEERFAQVTRDIKIRFERLIILDPLSVMCFETALQTWMSNMPYDIAKRISKLSYEKPKSCTFPEVLRLAEDHVGWKEHERKRPLSKKPLLKVNPANPKNPSHRTTAALRGEGVPQPEWRKEEELSHQSYVEEGGKEDRILSNEDMEGIASVGTYANQRASTTSNTHNNSRWNQQAPSAQYRNQEPEGNGGSFRPGGNQRSNYHQTHRCNLCREGLQGHRTIHCTKEMTEEALRAEVQKYKICLACGDAGHWAKDCGLVDAMGWDALCRKSECTPGLHAVSGRFCKMFSKQ